jgi:urease accessory protein
MRIPYARRDLGSPRGAHVSADTSAALLALLQLADGLFPAGAFAHSLGLETYAQDGIVKDAGGLERFVRAHLDGSAGPADAVAVAHVVRCARDGDLSACLAIDARLDAMRFVPEFTAASRQMGRQTLRVAAAWDADSLLTALAERVEVGATPGHYPVVFGAAAGRAGIQPEPAASAFLYATASMLVNASLRLLAIGQLEGQRVLARLRPRIAELAAAADTAAIDDMWSFTPGLELAGLRHAELDMRLFRS